MNEIASLFMYHFVVSALSELTALVWGRER